MLRFDFFLFSATIELNNKTFNSMYKKEMKILSYIQNTIYNKLLYVSDINKNNDRRLKDNNHSIIFMVELIYF